MLVLVFFLCCCLIFRRRRARNTGGLAQPGTSGWGNGTVGGPAVQEAGYASGPGHNNGPGWNAGGQPAYGGGAYQPPQGPPPGVAPQPGGFAPVS